MESQNADPFPTSTYIICTFLWIKLNVKFYHTIKHLEVTIY